MIRTLAALLLAAGAAGSALAYYDELATIELKGPGGEMKARAVVWDRGRDLQVGIQAAGLPPGRYGAHIHAVGRCDGPDFESAGPHWNPGNRQHGSLNPEGPHLGDLPNIEVDAESHGRLEFTVEGTNLAGLLDADGAALVLHAAPDDFRTDPAGNTGARIACGVISVG